MASARDAVSGFERLVTRSLAIVAIAVAAGAAHSWMHGPLDLETSASDPLGVPPERTDPGETPPLEGADPSTGSPQPTNPTTPQETAALPEGHITIEQAYDHFVYGTADFIDARTADVYAEGHIAGALNLSLEMTKDTNRVQDVFVWLDKSRPVVVYCRGGLCSEAKDVGRLLSQAGFAHVLIFADGFPGWKDAGYMVDTGSGQ